MRDIIIDDTVLRQATRMVVEEELREIDRQIHLYPVIFRPQFQKRMDCLLDSFRPSVMQKRNHSFLCRLKANQHQSVRTRIRVSRRYFVIAVLIMVGMSMAALANDDVRQSINRFCLQFFPDNVTVREMTGTMEEDENVFHIYKWENIPEGYKQVYEEDNSEIGLYKSDFENEKGNFIHYMQNDASIFTISITYDEQEGYNKIIDLNGVEVHSVSDGKRNTVFFIKNGYLFEFMSDESERRIIDFINISGIMQNIK